MMVVPMVPVVVVASGPVLMRGGRPVVMVAPRTVLVCIGTVRMVMLAVRAVLVCIGTVRMVMLAVRAVLVRIGTVRVVVLAVRTVLMRVATVRMVMPVATVRGMVMRTPRPVDVLLLALGSNDLQPLQHGLLRGGRLHRREGRPVAMSAVMLAVRSMDVGGLGIGLLLLGHGVFFLKLKPSGGVRRACGQGQERESEHAPAPPPLRGGPRPRAPPESAA